MLKKILKYDMNAVWKLWVALSAALLGMTVILSLLVRFSIIYSLENADTLFYFFIAISTGLFGVGLISAWSGILIVTPIMCYVRYFKNFFSDEGYLTFTLPVKRSTLYMSKVVNVFIFNVGNVVVTILALLLASMIIPATGDNGAILNFEILKGIFEFFALIWEEISAWMLVYLLGIILLAAVCSLYQIGMIHLCITVGATVAKKHKVLAGIGIYMGVSFILSSLYQLFGVFGFQSIEGFIYQMEGLQSETMIHLIFVTVMLLAIVVVAVAAAILHLVTLNTIERKLNLA